MSVAAPELGHSFGLAPAEFKPDNSAFVHVLLGVHEAGHAALAEDLGYPVTGVELFPTATGHSGRTHIDASELRADDCVLFALAGPAAEWLWLRQQLDRGLHEDMFRVLTRSAICPDDQQLLDKSLQVSTFRTLQDGFAAACRWVERNADGLHHRAAELMTTCACRTV